MKTEISRVVKADLSQITELQNALLAGNRNTADGFLVSAFPRRDYKKYLGFAEFFMKAETDGVITGVLLAYSSRHISADDVNNSLLRHIVKGEFLLVKQIFVTPGAAGQGIGSRLYTLLDKLNHTGGPTLAVIVKEPINRASCRFHRKHGYTEFLEFEPAPDRDGRVRLRSV